MFTSLFSSITLADQAVDPSGTADGNVCVWDVNPPDNPHAQGPEVTLQPISVLSGGHQNTPVRALAFNPRLGMFATGGTELVSKFHLRSDERAAAADVLRFIGTVDARFG